MAQLGCRKSVGWRLWASTPSLFLNMSPADGNCPRSLPWHSPQRVLHDYEFSHSSCKTTFIILHCLRKIFDDRCSLSRADRTRDWGRLETDDYTALGLTFENSRTRIARLAEALEVIRRYFTMESVDFAGDYYRINHMEALPRCVQRPNPPILVGAGGPRMLDLAGRTADIVGIHARMGGDVIDQAQQSPT